MKQVIEKHFCDICKTEIENFRSLTYPVIFHTDQTEGRSCDPYISYEKIEVCNSCASKILKVSAVGAQGLNHYEVLE